jgi:hypothetical protein
MAVGTAAVISAGISLAGAGANFAQAAKQKKLVRQAEEEAAKYMEEARQKIGVNYMEQLQVPLEGYEAAAKMNLAAGMQATEALRETDQRAVLGGTGKILEQQNRAAEDLRFQMQRDIYERDRAVMSEDSRIAQQLADIDLETLQGAQLAAASADINRANAFGDAFGGITQAGLTAFEGSDLYKKNVGDKAGETIGRYGDMTSLDVADRINQSGLNYFEKRSLAKKGQGSQFFDPGMFYPDASGLGAFMYPTVNPRNPFQ